MLQRLTKNTPLLHDNVIDTRDRGGNRDTDQYNYTTGILPIQALGFLRATILLLLKSEMLLGPSE